MQPTSDDFSSHLADGPDSETDPEHDEELALAIRESAEVSDHISPDRAQRFYDRVRARIERYTSKKSNRLEKGAEFLLLVPDLFILLTRLLRDSRVSGRNKVLLGSGVAYYIFPFDIIPEAIVGPIGYLDDLVFGVYILNKVLVETDVAIVREHWSGSEDILAMIQRVLASADNLIGSKLVDRIKKMVK